MLPNPDVRPRRAGATRRMRSVFTPGRRAPLAIVCGLFVGLAACSPAQNLDSLRAAAEQGDAAAQFDLGSMAAAEGRGVPQDGAEAVRWYRLAAEQGHALAQAGLGVLYAEGRGVRQDDPEAVLWLRRAADQGIAEAQGRLGMMYAAGRSVPRSYAEAVRWYRLAADQRHAQAQANLGFAYG